MARSSETVTVRIADTEEVKRAISDAHEAGFQLALTMLRDRGDHFAMGGHEVAATVLLVAADALARGTHVGAGGDSEQ